VGFPRGSHERDGALGAGSRQSDLRTDSRSWFQPIHYMAPLRLSGRQPGVERLAEAFFPRSAQRFSISSNNRLLPPRSDRPLCFRGRAAATWCGESGVLSAFSSETISAIFN
jgi:hypothetical protein